MTDITMAATVATSAKPTTIPAIQPAGQSGPVCTGSVFALSFESVVSNFSEVDSAEDDVVCGSYDVVSKQCVWEWL